MVSGQNFTWRNYLADSSNVTSLSIPSNNLGDAGVSAIAAALAKNRSVRKLWLQANGISNGVRDLVNWIHVWIHHSHI